MINPPKPLKLLSLVIICAILSGCATSSSKIVPIDQQGLSDKLLAEDRELRLEVQQSHDYLTEKNAFYEEPAFERYLSGIANRVVEDLNFPENSKPKLKVLKDSTINAVTMATGHIYFHSGILGRLENEAQLAFVIAHEIAHNYYRDSLYFMQNLKRKTVTLKVMDVLITPAAAAFGVGNLSVLTLNLVYGASIAGYGREAESRADQFAFEHMLKVGYDPSEAVKVFNIFLGERDRFQKGTEIYFLSSHPSNQKRIKAANKWVTEHQAEISRKEVLITGEEDYLRQSWQLRLENAELNYQFDRFFHALEDLERLKKERPNEPRVQYYLGEVYRRLPGKWEKVKEELSTKKFRELKKGKKKEDLEKEWSDKALEAYTNAIKTDPNFTPSYKGLGDQFMAIKMYEEAERSYKQYIKLNPGAKNRRSVDRALRDIGALRAA